MLLTPKQAALLLQCHEATVRRRAHAGTLKAQRIGRHIRIPLDQFSDIVDVEAAKRSLRIAAARAGVNTEVDRRPGSRTHGQRKVGGAS